MYALALLMSAGTTSATTGLPYFHLGALDVGIPIQWFGMIVAAGVLIGAVPLRRYAEWHGVSDEHIRGLLTWIMISGFLGAHELDVIAYSADGLLQTRDLDPASWWFLGRGTWPSNWPLVLRIWDGISSYGGFLGGALGFALYVWWKRLPARLFGDIAIVGLLPAFSIGRIGCTVVSDHIGATVDLDRWYAFLAMDYPRKLLADLYQTDPGPGEMIRAWNLGLIEFLYLVPVNLLILWLAFNPSKRRPAGFVLVLTGVLYAPVRFLLDFLRPEGTDPRHYGLTFAQWSSILAFGVAVYAATRILKTGVVAETVAPTSREAQERLRIILREDEDVQEQQEAEKQTQAERKKAELAKARAEREREDAEAAAAVAAEREKARNAASTRDDEEDDDEDDADAGEADAGKADAGKAEAGKADAGKADAGKADAGKADAAKPAAGAGGGKAGGASASTRPGGNKAGSASSGGKSGGSRSGASKNNSRKR